MPELFKRKPVVGLTRARYNQTQRVLLVRLATTQDAITSLTKTTFAGWPQGATPPEASAPVLSAVVALKEASAKLCRALSVVDGLSAGE